MLRKKIEEALLFTKKNCVLVLLVLFFLSLSVIFGFIDCYIFNVFCSLCSRRANSVFPCTDSEINIFFVSFFLGLGFILCICMAFSAPICLFYAFAKRIIEDCMKKREERRNHVPNSYLPLGYKKEEHVVLTELDE